MGVSHHKQPGLLTQDPTWPRPSWNSVLLIEIKDSDFFVAILTSPPAHSGITGAFLNVLVKEMCSGLGVGGREVWSGWLRGLVELMPLDIPISLSFQTPSSALSMPGHFQHVNLISFRSLLNLV